MEQTTRRCIGCDVVKPLGEFDGYKTCNTCRPRRAAWFYEKRRIDPEWAERVRKDSARSQRSARERQRADPEYDEAKRAERRERNRNARRRLGHSVTGDVIATACAACGISFTYVFQGRRHRTKCDLCALYSQEFRYYGLTGAQVVEMLKQKACQICGSSDAGRKDGRFRIDHCHETGEVRGVLCHPCNIALGLMKDSPEVLRAAARYLEQTRK